MRTRDADISDPSLRLAGKGATELGRDTPCLAESSPAHKYSGAEVPALHVPRMSYVYLVWGRAELTRPRPAQHVQPCLMHPASPTFCARVARAGRRKLFRRQYHRCPSMVSY
eukprot:scaffold172956_cov31-Tisochrysis_lutea.AAC.3